MKIGAAIEIVALAFGATAASRAAPPSTPAPDGNVVVINVRTVMVPRRLPGRCQIMGVVREVRSGEAFQAGEPISIAVPCADHSRPPQWRGPPRTPGSRWPIPLDAEVLRRSKLGVARLDDMGELIWRGPSRVYGRYGRVWGYRVLDGVFLPLGDRRT